MTSRSAAALIASVAFALPSLLGAQSVVASADSALRHGLLPRAESLYYAGVRIRPRDPVARWSLGNFLIERGAKRIGMTLVEEAMQFGLDKDRGGRTLAPVYRELEEYRKLLALPGMAVSPGTREQVRYLESHPARVIAPDSILTAAYAPGTTKATFGTITIRVNGMPISADIVNDGPPIVIAEGSQPVARAHRFAPETVRGQAETPAVLDSLGIARLVVVNAPVTIAALPAGTAARISLTYLSRFTPAFNPSSRTITLRTGAGPSSAGPVNAFVTLASDGRLSVLKAGGWAPLDDPSIVRLIDGRRWTIDARHGVIDVAR